jgi:hypothetical protein
MRAQTLLGAGLAIAAITAVTAAPSVVAAEESGTAIAVRQSTSASGPDGNRVLQASAPVFSGDRIVTSSQGQAQIQFLDQTKLVVGPNSSLLIDQFVFAGTKANKVSISAVKGAFRFITGVSSKQAYSIKTPTATIGVRGTQFDVSVLNGVTSFALYEGGARVCDNRGRCLDLRGNCEVAVIPSQNDIQRLSRGIATTEYLAANLPFVRSQSSLLPAFRVDASGCGVGRTQSITPSPSFGSPPPAPPAPPSDGDGGDGGEGDGGEGGGNL